MLLNVVSVKTCNLSDCQSVKTTNLISHCYFYCNIVYFTKVIVSKLTKTSLYDTDMCSLWTYEKMITTVCTSRA